MHPDLRETDTGPAVSRRHTCRLCDGRELELALGLAPTPIADAYWQAERLGETQPSYPLDLYLCRKCGHVQLLDVIDPEVLFGDYVYVTASSPGLVEHFRTYALDLLDRLRPKEGSLVVEIGSNDGSQLRFFKDRGMEVLGVDPARDLARRATESGIETLAAYFTEELGNKLKAERGPAAIVTANNVFAHADDLADIARGVRGLLAPDGAFVFEVSYLVDIVDRLLFDTVYHEHLCYHSVKPLQSFFERLGMELIGVERVSPKGGSIRGTVQLAGGPRAVSPAVADLVTLEEGMGLQRPELYSEFAAKIDRVKSELLAILSGLKAEGKTVAGYGASHTVTTLVHHFDLGDKLEFIVDDNLEKQGTFSPGHHVSVLAPGALYECKPDYVIVLAWNYAKPIMEKHQSFLDGGGHFIVPLPEVQVV